MLNHRDGEGYKKDVEQLTEGDEEFRDQFISWCLGELTMVDIQNYLEEKDTILVPVASTEQHGPHLPLFTDISVATEITSRVAEHIGVMYAPPVWTGYSPHHVHRPENGRGTITLRSETFHNLLYDIGRSLIHHGFNRIMFINGHGSNVKVIDPLVRKLRYDTGALISFIKPYMENYEGVLEGLLDNPPEETPGWHASELETSFNLALDEELVRMDRAEDSRAHVPDQLPDSFKKDDGLPDVEFEGYKYFTFPMEHHEFIENGTIGNPMRATAEKGEEAFKRYSQHVAKGILELEDVDVDIHTREFKDRAM